METETPTRLCNGQCARWLPETSEYFAVEKRCIGGLRRVCRDCRRGAWHAWANENREEMQRRKRERRAANPTPFRESRKRLYHAHKDKERAANAQYQKEHRAELSAREKVRDRCRRAIAQGKRDLPAGFTLIFIERTETYVAVPGNRRLYAGDIRVAEFLPYADEKRADCWVVIEPTIVAPQFRGRAAQLEAAEMKRRNDSVRTKSANGKAKKGAENDAN